MRATEGLPDDHESYQHATDTWREASKRETAHPRLATAPLTPRQTNYPKIRRFRPHHQALLSKFIF